MPADLFRMFRTLVEETFWSRLTRRGYAKLFVLLTGWVLTVDSRHAVTAALVAAGVAGVLHHEGFHRFFSRGSWDPDALGLAVADRVVDWQGVDAGLRCVVDDTLSEHKGALVFGLGCHINAVRSTRALKVFSFGHCWVVVALVVRVPFSTRWWALPVLFRLYRQEKVCRAAGQPYKKKTELAREMLDLLCARFPDRPIEGTGDLGYCNGPVLKDRPAHLTWFGAMRPDAAITAAPPPPVAGHAGRPRTRGARLPSPEQVARDPNVAWRRTRVTLYGVTQWVRYKTYEGQWYSVCGIELLRIVIVETGAGTIPYRIYFCTDRTAAPGATLEGYASRWSIEVFYLEGKQFLGLAESSARLENAVLRVVPFVGWLYTLLVLWFAAGAWKSPLAAPPVRPWYPDKDGASFADILRTARRAFAGADILAEARGPGNLHQFRPPYREPEQLALPLAA